jgi:putative acetyltransferase
MMSGQLVTIRLNATSVAEVLALYQATSRSRSGLARSPEEIDEAYVRQFLERASADGVALGARASDGSLAGEVHAVRMAPRQFRHVLTDLTIAVHPDWQGKGVGTRLFNATVERARSLRPPIARIELIAREGNADAIRLYERLGFVGEGRFRKRVRLANGEAEDDIPMALLL